MVNISTSAFYDSAIYNLGKLRDSTNKLQQQISTGNKLTNSYDDPLASAQMRSLQAADTLYTADTANAATAKTRLTQTDSTLSQVTTIISQIKTLATQAANSTLNTSDRSAIGKQVEAYYQNLVSLANSKEPGGNALFGGQGAGDAYVTDASGNLTYNGTSSASTLSLGSGLTVTTGVTGPDFMNFTGSDGSATDLLSVVKNLATNLQDTSLSSTDVIAAAQSGMTDMDTALDTASTAQTIVGARLAWLSTSSTLTTAANTQRTTQEASVGGTDLTTAAAQLTQQMTALEAAQASFVKLSSLSLFSMLN